MPNYSKARKQEFRTRFDLLDITELDMLSLHWNMSKSELIRTAVKQFLRDKADMVAKEILEEYKILKKEKQERERKESRD